jgi:hypothetical protein
MCLLPADFVDRHRSELRACRDGSVDLRPAASRSATNQSTRPKTVVFFLGFVPFSPPSSYSRHRRRRRFRFVTFVRPFLLLSLLCRQKHSIQLVSFCRAIDRGQHRATSCDVQRRRARIEKTLDDFNSLSCMQLSAYDNEVHSGHMHARTHARARARARTYQPLPFAETNTATSELFNGAFYSSK